MPPPQLRNPCIYSEIRHSAFRWESLSALILQNSNENYIFFAPAAALAHQALRGIKENDSHTWNNLNPYDDVSQFLPQYVCSNLTIHLGHLILIGTDSDYTRMIIPSLCIHLMQSGGWLLGIYLSKNALSNRQVVQPQDSRAHLGTTHTRGREAVYDDRPICC